MKKYNLSSIMKRAWELVKKSLAIRKGIKSLGKNSKK